MSDKRVLSGCCCLLNTLGLTLLWEFVLWEMNKRAMRVTFTELVRGEAGHGSVTLLYATEN